MRKLPLVLLLSASLVPTAFSATEKVKPLSVSEAKVKAEDTAKQLMIYERAFLGVIEAGASKQQIKKNISNPLIELSHQWSKYPDDQDAQNLFLNCRDAISGLTSLISATIEPISKDPQINDKMFNDALNRYTESAEQCEKTLEMTDAQLTEMMQKRLKDKCEKPTVIYDVKSGEMIEQSKPDYCNN